MTLTFVFIIFVILVVAGFAILLTVLCLHDNTSQTMLTKVKPIVKPSTKLLQLTKSEYDDSLFEVFEAKCLSDSCYLVLIHLGEELPLHVFDCIDQLCLMGAVTVHFIVDSTSSYQRLTFCDRVIPYLYRSEPVLRAKMNAVHGNENVFHLSLERFFALQWFMNKYNIDKCIHIEHDNLIYVPLGFVETQLNEIIGSKIATPRDCADRCIASIFYVGSRVALDKYCDFVENEENFRNIDMASLSNFEIKYPDFCSHLPVIPKEYVSENQNNFSDNRFPFIFDAAALGQWVGGVDVIHTTFGTDSRGFINPDAQKYYNANDMPVVWILSKSGKQVPLTKYEVPKTSRTIYTRLCNLHIHSKRLHLYLSTSYMDPNDIIQGNKFKEFSDIQFHSLEQIMMFGEQERKFIKKPEIIYVKTDFLNEFFQYAVPKIVEGQFILITHNSDYCVSEEHLSYLNHEKLLKWFGQNCQIEHPKLIPIPIGIANSEFEHGNTNVLLESMKSKVIQENKLYVNLSDTHIVRKQLIDYYTKHENEQVYFEKNRLTYHDFLVKMKSYQFVCAPRGNGPDTHRLWEIYYLNSIAITYDQLFHTIPCIPKHYLPFIDVNSFEWPTYSEEQTYLTQIRGLGRLYSRMSYWKFLIRNYQKSKKNIDVVLITDDIPEHLNSILQHVENLNKIYILRTRDVSSEDTKIANENIMMMKIEDFCPNHNNNEELIKLHLHRIPKIKQKILWVDSRLCFTGNIHFQTCQNKDLYTSTKSNDKIFAEKIQELCPNIELSLKLNVHESYHAVFDRDILKELQEKVNQNISISIPTHVLYFHYLQTFHQENCKIRNLFFLNTNDKKEYREALQSHYYRFVVNLS